MKTDLLKIVISILFVEKSDENTFQSKTNDFPFFNVPKNDITFLNSN